MRATGQSLAELTTIKPTPSMDALLPLFGRSHSANSLVVKNTPSCLRKSEKVCLENYLKILCYFLTRD